MEIGILAVAAAAWAAILAITAADLLRIRPLPARRRLQGYGLMLITTSSLANVFAEVGGWAQSQQRITHIVMLPLSMAGLAMVVGGQVMRGRRHGALRHSPGA